MRAGTRSRSTACADARRTGPEPSRRRDRTARRNPKRLKGLPRAPADAATEPRGAPAEPGRRAGSWRPGNLKTWRADAQRGVAAGTPAFQVSSFPDPQTARGPARASQARAGSRPSISQNGQKPPVGGVANFTPEQSYAQTKSPPSWRAVVRRPAVPARHLESRGMFAGSPWGFGCDTLPLLSIGCGS